MPRDSGSNRQRHDLIETVIGMENGVRYRIIEFRRSQADPQPVRRVTELGPSFSGKHDAPHSFVS